MNDIDLVYLWVDGNDPKWIARRNAFIGTTTNQTGANCDGRYADNDELKYSLRSVEKYAPWIRRIFIVTDGQTPRWLDIANPKIQIVDHTEIMPAQCLPCFNSVVIEHHLHRIPGLSERFLSANDDTLLTRPVTPATFFAADGLPIIRFKSEPFRTLKTLLTKHFRCIPVNNYSETIRNSAILVEKKYRKFYGERTHHNIDAYRKSDYAHAREIFETEIQPTLCNHGRAATDIQRILYSYVALAEGRAHAEHVTNQTSLRIQFHRERGYRKFQECRPVFLCMNDSEHATEADRKRAVEFLEKLFPEKSQFEK